MSPHGHCDPGALADDTPFEQPATELVTKDHYILRMLYSQGVPLEALGVQPLDGSPAEVDGRRIWRELAAHYPLFRGTPSKLWLDHTLEVVLGVEVPLRADNADAVYEEISTRLQEPEFRPRALYDRFGIAFLATTEGALDPLERHARLRQSGWNGRVVPTFRPDDVVDPDRAGFLENVAALGHLTGADTSQLGGLPGRVAEPAGRVRRGGGDRVRPRAPFAGHGGSVTTSVRSALRPAHGRRRRAG